MFQGLSQGAIIPILFKNEPRVADGKILSVNTHMPVYNPGQPMGILNGPVTDITVQVGNDTIPFAGLPANGVVANFPDRGIFLATDKSAVLREIESMLSASKQAIEQMPAHQRMVKSCEDLILQLNPDLKKEAQQAKDIESLREKMSEMGSKFDKIMELLSAKNLGTS